MFFTKHSTLESIKRYFFGNLCPCSLYRVTGTSKNKETEAIFTLDKRMKVEKVSTSAVHTFFLISMLKLCNAMSGI